MTGVEKWMGDRDVHGKRKGRDDWAMKESWIFKGDYISILHACCVTGPCPPQKRSRVIGFAALTVRLKISREGLATHLQLSYSCEELDMRPP